MSLRSNRNEKRIDKKKEKKEETNVGGIKWIKRVKKSVMTAAAARQRAASTCADPAPLPASPALAASWS